MNRHLKRSEWAEKLEMNRIVYSPRFENSLHKVFVKSCLFEHIGTEGTVVWIMEKFRYTNWG